MKNSRWDEKQQIVAFVRINGLSSCDNTLSCLHTFLASIPFFRRCATCRRKRSLRTGSFFREFPRIPLGKLVVLMYLWSHRELPSTVARMLSLTRNTVGNVYAVVRHYCGRDLEDQPVTPFGGRVFVVKSDESQFRHKSKVRVLFSMNTEIHP